MSDDMVLIKMGDVKSSIKALHELVDILVRQGHPGAVIEECLSTISRLILALDQIRKRA